MTNQPAAPLPSAIAEYVLPAPPRQPGAVVVVANAHDSATALRRGGEVARAIGDHFLALAECQQLFCTELRERLLQVDSAIAEATRAQWKGAVRDVLHVLEWVDTVQADLVAMSRTVAVGAEPVDLAEVCGLVAAQCRANQRQVDVWGSAAGPWWGDAASLHDAVRLAVALVTERIGGAAAVRIVIESAAGQPSLCITSSGEPTEAVDATTVQRFRDAVERIGGKVRPDALGAGGSGMVIDLAAANG